MILEYNQDVKLPSAPISRSLLPFQRIAHFSTCVATSVGAFFRLELLLESDQALPNLVKAFKFRVRNSLASIPLTRLASFLPKLPNLEWLTLLDYQPDYDPILPQSDLLLSFPQWRLQSSPSKTTHFPNSLRLAKPLRLPTLLLPLTLSLSHNTLHRL